MQSIKQFLGIKANVPSHREIDLYGSPLRKFSSNNVATSRYNVVTFVPMNLLMQFMKPANIYFLVISILQVIPSISLSGAMPTVAIPLTIVVIVNMIKDGVEDYKRHVSDEKENSQIVSVLNAVTGALDARKWREVKVGDVIVVQNHSQSPSDMVLLATSDKTGLAFIETANLDGETNLKLKVVPKELDPLSLNGAATAADAARKLVDSVKTASLQCQLPNNALYQFEGSLSLSKSADIETSSGPIALSTHNMILRGCKLRNTTWAIGMVVYTGQETKIQMNSRTVPRKVSSLERLMGQFTLIAFLIQLILCIIGALVWGLIASSSTFQIKLYLGFTGLTTSEVAGKSILKFFSYVILFSNFIPISLTVTMGIVKVFQSQLIHTDESMRRSTIVRSSDLNEELGQVDFIFSDKTGTLTCNKMEFRKACINGVSYGEGITEIRRNMLRKQGQIAPEDPEPLPGSKVTHSVNFIDPESKLASILAGGNANKGKKDYRDAVMFFVSLAVNHSVMIEGADASVYSASSPDEGALTYGAKHFGFEFIARDPRGVIVLLPDGRRLFVEQLAAFEFTSTRKRSSLLCRCVDPLSTTGNTKTFLMIKGADSVMIPRLSTASKASPGTAKMIVEMNQYALDGLRTLCVAFREVSDHEITNWLAHYKEASASLTLREKKLEALAEQIERDVELVGVSAIEDKLQANVGDTIDSLRNAGIKVWMLTGDKLETAVNIGLATSLINTSGMYRVVIDKDVVDAAHAPGKAADTFKRFLDKTLKEFRCILRMDPTMVLPANANGASEVALIVDGAALDALLKKQTYRRLFAETASLCASVICCRVSPEQKGAVVTLIREAHNKICLAIGDGANDCNMIQSANIGVGLKGEEGMQAFNASDYGVCEFQALKPLLLVHGRWAYRRIAKLILYMFYKNVVVVMPSYLLNIMTSLFSGQRVYEEFMYQLFNVIFTALPIIVFGVFEQDLSKRDCLAFPQLYRIGPIRGHATKRTFAKWMLTGFWHSVCVFFVPYYAMGGINIVNSDGIPSDLWLFGIIVYLSIIVVVNVKLVLESYYLNGLFVAAIFVSVALWFASLKIIEHVPLPTAAGAHGVNLSPSLAGLSYRMYTSPMTFFLVFAAVSAALLRDFIFKAYRYKFRARDYHIVMANVSKKHQQSVRDRDRDDASSVQRAATLEDITVFTENDPNSEQFLQKQRRSRVVPGSHPLEFKLPTVNPVPLGTANVYSPPVGSPTASSRPVESLVQNPTKMATSVSPATVIPVPLSRTASAAGSTGPDKKGASPVKKPSGVSPP